MAQDPSTVPAEAAAAAAQAAPDPASAATVVQSASDAISSLPLDTASVLVAPAFDPSALPTPESMLAGNDSLALTKMGFSHLVQHTDLVGLIVLIVMAVMSILSWYYIFYNSFRLLAVKARVARVTDCFWDSATPKDALDVLKDQPEYEPFSKLALDAYDASEHFGQQGAGRMGEVLTRHEFIQRRVEHTLRREVGAFDSGLTLLATIGATAPFVGLFGTVWGIYHALINISDAGKATLDVVAGPVGEALIMTCMGLGVAIPAVLGFNFFVQSNRKLGGRLTTFGKDLLDFFATGARVRAQRYGSRTDTSPAGS